MIKSAFTRIWNGKNYEKDDPMPEATERQAKAMVDCGQAYRADEVAMDNTKDEIVDHLISEGIAFTEKMTKQELLDLL